MFHFTDKHKQEIINHAVEKFNKTFQNDKVNNSLDKNIDLIKKMFENIDVLKIRNIQNNHYESMKYCIAYCDGLVNSLIMNENIIKPLMLSTVTTEKNLVDTVIDEIVMINEIEKTDNFEKITEAITYGDTVLFIDGANEAVILNTKGFDIRSIDEPDSEKSLSGPREGFTEAILINLSLIRRKVRTSELKMKYYKFGRKTKTMACVCYMEGIVNKKILEEVYRRLDKIDIDGVLDTNYITELIKDKKYSPFRTTGYTERPDVVVGKLLEGRIAIFVDGTPVVLTVPYLFVENFQSNEDYYLSFFYSSFSRLLRIFGFILTISVPAVYVAAAGYHHEIFPTPFLINIASERASVPLPAFMEAIVLLFTFEIIKETGIRMPSNVGQALSIVGALVLGQAAVEAKLVASPMIIVIAITAITSLLVPKMNAPVIYVRFLLLLISISLGLYGFFLGLSGVLIHMLNLRSFGVPQFTLAGNLRFQDVKDIYFRAPWWNMITRPKIIAKDKVRMKVSDGENNG